jgi:hypothetical protein
LPAALVFHLEFNPISKVPSESVRCTEQVTPFTSKQNKC